MTCLDENLLIEIASGRGDPATLAQAESHLAGCDDCARAMAAVAQVVTVSVPDRGLDDTTAQGVRTVGVAPLLPNGTVLKDRYRILRLIGRGGMGEVYEAAHTRLAGRYAVKVLSLDFTSASAMLTRFKREAEITSALRHPNIVQVFDFDETPEGRPFLAMEYIEGRHLGEIIELEGPMGLPRVVQLIAPVVSALAAIHRQHIVHRDLKPQNIMLSSSPDDGAPVVKLLDFGLSKRWGTVGVESLAVSRDRALLGTPMYMAPEQARGDPDAVGPATDQFAMAAIVYEMLARQPPFAADSIHAILHRIIYADPTPLRDLVPSLPDGIAEAVGRALSKDPAQRFPSIRDFLDALRDPAGSLAGDVAALNAAAAPPRWGKRPSRIVMAVAVLSSAVAIATWMWSPRAPTNAKAAVNQGAIAESPVWATREVPFGATPDASTAADAASNLGRSPVVEAVASPDTPPRSPRRVRLTTRQARQAKGKSPEPPGDQTADKAPPFHLYPE